MAGECLITHATFLRFLGNLCPMSNVFSLSESDEKIRGKREDKR
jgi:hypothetical protein